MQKFGEKFKFMWKKGENSRISHTLFSNFTHLTQILHTLFKKIFVISRPNSQPNDKNETNNQDSSHEDGTSIALGRSRAPEFNPDFRHAHDGGVGGDH